MTKRTKSEETQVLDDIMSKSKFTEKDASEIGEAAKKGIAARYEKAMRKKQMGVESMKPSSQGSR
ncbi:MAG: hypothetical protein ABSE82_01360 [Nitrososphaerales archaeon]|jgi:hypothetical protein